MFKKTESKIDSHSKSSQTAYENSDNESINQRQLDSCQSYCQKFLTLSANASGKTQKNINFSSLLKKQQSRTI